MASKLFWPATANLKRRLVKSCKIASKCLVFKISLERIRLELPRARHGHFCIVPVHDIDSHGPLQPGPRHVIIMQRLDLGRARLRQGSMRREHIQLRPCSGVSPRGCQSQRVIRFLLQFFL